MANGRLRTLDEFGSPAWNSSLSPSAQRAAIQSALDSGEPLRAPCMTDAVTTDGPCYMDFSNSLTGVGTSVWTCADKDQDCLVIRSSYATVERIQFDHASLGAGRGVVVGPTPTNDYAIYVTLRDIHTTANNKFGVDLVGAGGSCVMGGSLYGDLASWHLGNVLGGVNHDAGDHKVIGTDTNANNSYGACYFIESGGGIYIGQPKAVQGQNHIKLYPTGSSGNLTVSGGSFEGNTSISVDINCQTVWERVALTGVSIGVAGVAVAARNVTGTLGAGGVPNLMDLAITGCVTHTVGNAGPVYDIGSVRGFSVIGGSINGNGTAQCGVYARPQSSNGSVLVPVRGCVSPNQNFGTNVTMY